MDKREGEKEGYKPLRLTTNRQENESSIKNRQPTQPQGQNNNRNRIFKQKTMNSETENTDFNRLTLKALLLSVITELKFNEPIHPNAKNIKKAYKEATQLPKNASNEKVLQALHLTYKENDLEEDFLRIVKKFGAENYLQTSNK